MLEALRAGAVLEEEGASSWARSRPRFIFLGAVLEFFGAARAFFSSSARRASFSAFLRAASSRLAASASLGARERLADAGLWRRREGCSKWQEHGGR